MAFNNIYIHEINKTYKNECSLYIREQLNKISIIRSLFNCINFKENVCGYDNTDNASFIYIKPSDSIEATFIPFNNTISNKFCYNNQFEVPFYRISYTHEYCKYNLEAEKVLAHRFIFNNFIKKFNKKKMHNFLILLLNYVIITWNNKI